MSEAQAPDFLVLDPLRLAGGQVPVPGELRLSAALISTTRLGFTISTKWTRWCSSMTCWCRGSAIFLLGNVELGNGYAAGTQSDAHTGHQILNRCLVKAEFMLGRGRPDSGHAGVREHSPRAGAGGGADHRPRRAAGVRPGGGGRRHDEPVRDDVTGRERNSGLGAHVFGRSMFPRMVEIIQQLGTGGLMALPGRGRLRIGYRAGDRALLCH